MAAKEERRGEERTGTLGLGEANYTFLNGPTVWHR